MLFFSIQTSLSAEKIRERCAPYRENERHASWNVLEEYTSSRTGIHLYFTRYGFKCYYENGTTDRTDHLQSGKAWAFARIRETDGGCRVYGCTLFCPLLVFFVLYVLVEILFLRMAASFGMLFILCAIFLLCGYQEERAIIRQLKHLLQ